MNRVQNKKYTASLQLDLTTIVFQIKKFNCSCLFMCLTQVLCSLEQLCLSALHADWNINLLILLNSYSYSRVHTIRRGRWEGVSPAVVAITLQKSARELYKKPENIENNREDSLTQNRNSLICLPLYNLRYNE